MSNNIINGWPGEQPKPGTATYETEKSRETIRYCSVIVRETMLPLVESINKLMMNNTEALERLASAQAIQNDRLAALEKQIRLQTLVTPKQAGYLNDAIRSRARALLTERGIEDKKAITKLGNAIRKSVLMRYGVASLREIPQHEYTVAMRQIETWNDALAVLDVAKEAREREEQAASAMAEQSASADA